MNEQQLRKLAGLPPAAEKKVLTERYEGSHEFDADIGDADKNLKAALKVVQSPNWKRHMKDTDDNYSTKAIQKSADVERKIKEAIRVLDDLYDHMLEAS
jgi:hypothetical protein